MPGVTFNNGTFHMPAYIFIKTKVTDGEQYMKYVEAAQPLAAKYGRRFLVTEPARGDA